MARNSFMQEGDQAGKVSGKPTYWTRCAEFGCDSMIALEERHFNLPVRCQDCYTPEKGHILPFSDEKEGRGRV